MTEELNGGCLDEREAFVKWLGTTYPHSYNEEDAEHLWHHNHVAALAWKRRASLSTSKQAGAEPVEYLRAVGDGTHELVGKHERGAFPVYATPPAVMPAAPSDAGEQTPHDIVWAAYAQDLPRARLTVHSSHFNTSAPVWFERGYHAALSQTMQPQAEPAAGEQTGAVAMPALSCKHSNRSDCGLFGMEEAAPVKFQRPSREWYAAKIAETLDDDFVIGTEPLAAPGAAIAAREQEVTEDFSRWARHWFGSEADPKSIAKAIACMPTPPNADHERTK